MTEEAWPAGLPVSVARASPDPPLFDAHVHYGRDAWDVLPPEEAIAILDRAGVARALVSSTPDDGTLRWIAERWERMPEVLDGVRKWLRQLPPEVREKIARENGDRLFP